MLPIVLDASRLRIALFGEGPRAARRLALLREGGAADVTRIAGDPADADVAAFDLIYVADMPPADARAVAQRARAAGRLVNVEDVTELCDFHTPAVVRRGALTLTVSTGGLAPGLSGVLAAYLGRIFGTVWSIRLGLLETKRRNWRRRGLTHGEVRDALGCEIERNGWLPELAEHTSGANRAPSNLRDAAAADIR
ncbi:MAG: siroheme synthase [Rhodospirillales bacterium]|nr:siroheme synthase [Rhodospirillales bacterium]